MYRGILEGKGKDKGKVLEASSGKEHGNWVITGAVFGVPKMRLTILRGLYWDTPRCGNCLTCGDSNSVPPITQPTRILRSFGLHPTGCCACAQGSDNGC